MEHLTTEVRIEHRGWPYEKFESKEDHFAVFMLLPMVIVLLIIYLKG